MQDDQGYRKPGVRLRSKLLLGIVVVQCLLMAAMLFVVEQRMRKSILDEFSKRGLSIAKNLAAVNTPYIATYNYVSIEQSVQHVKEENGLLYAVVLFYDGEVAIYTAPEYIRQEVLFGAFQKRAVASQEPLVQYGVLNHSEVYDITAPIFLKEDKWGTVRTGFEMQDMHHAVLSTRRSLLMLCFLGLFGGCLGALYFARRITRPIGTLVESVEAVSSGNYDHSIGIDSNDEIGFFGQRFMAMQETIKEHIQLLTETNLELTASNEKLQREILERERAERELVKAKEAAETASMTKSQFLANMSHEIRTPMNGVLGMTELLLCTDLSEKQQEFAEMAHTSAKSLLGIINDILDLSKIEAGRLDLEIVHFDLRKTIQETVDLLDGQARAKGLELLCTTSLDVPSALCGDPLRLKQILTNLIGNAIKFTSRGLVSVRVLVDEDWPESSVIRCEVEDAGIGIPQEARDRIFDAFAQADGSFTRKYGGTGLGLTISRLLVQKMGGRMGVESETGKGSTFWFTACLGKQPGAHASLSSEDSAPRPNPEEKTGESRAHVLLAEDHPVNQLVTMSMLESLGCTAHVV